MENLNNVEECKEMLKNIDHTTLIIPKGIQDFVEKYPSTILCNEITEELAKVLIEKDRLKLDVLIYFGGLLNPIIHNFLKKEVDKGDTLLIHHYIDKAYFTSVIKLNYIFDTLIIYKTPIGCIKICIKHGGIEFNNIVAIGKIPTQKKAGLKYIQDNDQKIFLKVAKRYLL